MWKKRNNYLQTILGSASPIFQGHCLFFPSLLPISSLSKENLKVSQSSSLQSFARHHGVPLSKREGRRLIHALTPNSCQAIEEIPRFSSLVNQHRTLKALRGSWHMFWTLLKLLHQPSLDQNFTMSPGWLQLFGWAHCQLLWNASSWAIQNFLH